MQKIAIIGAVAATLLTSSAFAQGVEFNVGPGRSGVYVGDRGHDWRRDREYRRDNDIVIRSDRYHRNWDRGYDRRTRVYSDD